jgi:hypothetical protein
MCGQALQAVTGIILVNRRPAQLLANSPVRHQASRFGDS